MRWISGRACRCTACGRQPRLRDGEDAPARAAVTTLDLYVLRKTSLPLVAAIAVLLAALLLARLVELLDLVVNHGGPFFLLLKMLAGLIPASLGLVLPCA